MAVRAPKTTSDETSSASAPARDGASLLSRLADEADLCLTVLGKQDRVVYSNAGFTKMLGFERTEAAGQPLGKLLTDDDLRALRTFGAGLTQERFQEEFFARTKAGEPMWLSGLFRRVFDANGEVLATAVLLQDVTEGRLLALQRDALEAIAGGATLNELAELICRRAESLTPDVICSILRVDEAGYLHPLGAPSLPPIYSQAIEGLKIGPTVGCCGTAAWRGEPVFVADINTDPLWEPYRDLPLPPGLRACWSIPIKLKNGRVAGTFAFYFRGGRGPTDLHRKIVATCVHLCTLAIERHESEANINHLAYFDHLTGLPNRGRLQSEIASVLAASSANPRRVALLCIDIDHFKYVNDTLGHSSGDLLLVEVARRLAAHAGETGIVGRMGGDEFVMALPGCNVDQAVTAADALQESLCQPVMVDGLSLPLSVSIGISIYPDDSADIDELLMNADVALYGAKRSGRGICKVFRPEMNARAEERMLLGTELKDALARGELDLHYQPQVRIGDGVVCGVEALTRWSHPALGNIPPDSFIPVAEETGLDRDAGHVVARRGVPATVGMARGRAERTDDLGQSLGTPFPQRLARADDRRRAAQASAQPADADAGDHRKRHDGRRPDHQRDAEVRACARRRPVHGRFRQGLFQPQRAGDAAALRAEDRPQLHQPDRARRRHQRHRHGRDRHRPQPRHDGGGRRGGNRQAIPDAQTARLQRLAGLFLRPADAGGSVPRLVSGAKKAGFPA